MLETVVLLVDDEVQFVEATMKRLSLRGFSVLIAYNGKQALDEFKKRHDIDVVILDMKMPVMDGMETLRELKSRFPLTEVISLTGQATIQDAVEGVKLGAFDYLLKPYDFDRLVEKIRDAKIKKSRQEGQIQKAGIDRIVLSRGD